VFDPIIGHTNSTFRYTI